MPETCPAVPGAAVAEIDLLLLCDHAEVVNGKLYVLGGGWTQTVRIIAPPAAGAPATELPPTQFAIAVSLLIDWEEAGGVLPVRIGIEDQAGHALLAVTGQLTAGRPPTPTPGLALRSTLAMPVALVFPHPGVYRARVDIPGQESSRTTHFEVLDQPAPLPGPVN